MLSTATNRTQFHFIERNRVSKRLGEAVNGSFRPNLTLKVAHFDQGALDLITIPHFDKVCYPGAGRSLPIRSSISPNRSLVTITSASWNTSLLAWRTSLPPILMSLV